MDFNIQLQERIDLIEKVIKERLIDEERYKEFRQKEIFSAMNYSILAGGKRLRPMLLLETARLFGGRDEELYDFITAIELIHTYSLVHDDLPAMDNDEYRRGRKTTHVVYGEAMGILAGDALLNYAFEVGLNGVLNSKNVNAAARALKVLADKAGVFGMIGGQTVDILSVNKQEDIANLDYINELKTGALIEAAMVMGAILSGAREEDILLIENIASNIGRAFQIQDDILDVTSTSEKLGKPIHSDEKNNKSTYVNLLGLEESSNKVKQLTDNAISSLVSLNRENEFLVELLLSLVYRKK